MELKENMRIVQELVPGKQITLCHIIANPDDVLYTKLGLDPKTDYTRSAIGVLTVHLNLDLLSTVCVFGHINNEDLRNWRPGEDPR